MQKLTGKQVTLIQETNWSELVAEIFERPYRFQQQAGCMPNGSIWTFTVPKTFDAWDLRKVDAAMEKWAGATPPEGMNDFGVELWWERENYPDFDYVMCTLARKGLIDPGEYALHIWW